MKAIVIFAALWLCSCEPSRPARTWSSSGEAVKSIAVSPDGKLAASAGGAGGVVVRELESGAVMSEFRENAMPVYAVSFSADSKNLAWGGLDGKLRIRSLSAGGGPAVLSGGKNPEKRIAKDAGWSVLAVGFSPDSKYLAAAGADGLIRLWQPALPSPAMILEGHRGAVNALGFFPDAKHLFSAGCDGAVIIWDMKNSRPAKEIKEDPQDCLLTAAVSRDGRYLAYAGYGKTIRVRDNLSDEQKCVITGHAAGITSLDFSADSSRLVSSSLDGEIRVWDTGQCSQELKFKASGSAVYSVKFAPDGKSLICASGSAGVRVFQLVK